MAAWNRKTLKNWENERFFEERLLEVKVSKFCSGSFHRDTDRRCSVQILVKFGRREVGEIVRYLPDKISPGSAAVATRRITPTICHVQPPTMYSDCSTFHPNRFTFGGVIAESVNTAKTRRKMNPIFSRRQPSTIDYWVTWH